MAQFFSLAVLAVTLALFVVVAPPRAVLTLGLGIWLLNATFFMFEAQYPALVGMALVVAAALKVPASGRHLAAICYIPMAVGAWGLLIAPFSVDRGASASRGVILIWLGLVVIAAGSRFRGRDVCLSAYIALMPFLLASYVIAAPEALGRFAGVFNNSNALGLAAFTLVALSFGVGRRAVFAAIVVTVPLLVQTGSRGGTLATVAALAAGLWVSSESDSSRPSWLRTALRLGLVIALFVGAWVFSKVRESSQALGMEESGLLRTSDSLRTLALESSWQSFLEGPILGYGIGIVKAPGLTIAPHVQVVALAVALGVVGIALYVAVVVMLLRLPWKHSPPLAALVAGALVSWLVESWMLGAGSALTGIFWIAVSALAADMRGHVGLRHDATATKGKDLTQSPDKRAATRMIHNR